MKKLGVLMVPLLASGGIAQAGDLSKELAPPVRVEAAGKPVDTEVGHAHPLAADWDGDGDLDLLVGQFGGGLLWIYENQNPQGTPKLAEGKKFQVEGEDGRVPTG